MSVLGVGLALGASLGWGVVDALRKHLASHLRPLPLAALLTAGQIPMFTGWHLTTGGVRPPVGYWTAGLACAGCALLGSVLFVAALRRSPISVTIPMLSTTPVFSALIAAALLGEVPSPMSVGGLALVVLGAFLLGRPKRGALTEPGVWMMLGTAALWSASATLDKAAMVYAPPPTHAMLQAILIVLGLLTILGSQRRLKELTVIRSHAAPYVLTIVLLTTAVALQLLAMKLIMVSLVEALKRAVGLAMAVASGRFFFQEPVTRSTLAAIGLMGLGVVILSLDAT